MQADVVCGADFPAGAVRVGLALGQTEAVVAIFPAIATPTAAAQVVLPAPKQRVSASTCRAGALHLMADRPAFRAVSAWVAQGAGI